MKNRNHTKIEKLILMVVALVMSLWLYCTVHLARADEVGQVEKLSLSFTPLLSSSKSTLIMPQVPTSRTELEFNMSFINRLVYWDNILTSYQASGSYASIGWKYEMGINPLMTSSSPLQVFYYHQSQHNIDRTPDRHWFPVENGFGIRLNFINRR